MEQGRSEGPDSKLRSTTQPHGAAAEQYRMRILYHHRINSKDGQFVHVEELIAALRRIGHDVIVVAPPVTERQEFGAESRLVRLMKRELPGPLYELLELAYSAIAYHRLRRAYHRHRPDILYERYNLFSLAGVLLKHKYGLPMLLEVNAPLAQERREFGGLALERLARWAERTTWRSADYVLPVSRVLGDHVHATGLPEDRIVVVPNGVDRNRFRLAATSDNPKRRLGLAGRVVLGFTGFVREWHGLEMVVDLIAERGPTSNLHLLVVGDGPARVDIEQRARDRGIADRVTFTGIVPHGSIVEYLAAFDVALQPAVRPYASPLKLIEYMALGRAIVAPASPNILEVLTHGETALLFEPQEPGSFRAAVEALCADSDLRDRLGAAARRAVEERNLTWEGNAHRVEELGYRLLARQAAGSQPALAIELGDVT